MRGHSLYTAELGCQSLCIVSTGDPPLGGLSETNRLLEVRQQRRGPYLFSSRILLFRSLSEPRASRICKLRKVRHESHEGSFIKNTHCFTEQKHIRRVHIVASSHLANSVALITSGSSLRELFKTNVLKWNITKRATAIAAVKLIPL
jgi:hypothetical protein